MANGEWDVREERVSDRPGICSLLEAAFPSAAEARLVERLRADGDYALSLVALEAGNILGCAAFSRMEAPFRALGLGPVAVAPSYQRQGIGSRLVREGIARTAAAGWDGIFVLGAPAYYRRFGFDTELAQGFASPYSGPHFMALALHGGLPVRAGAIHYARAFASLA